MAAAFFRPPPPPTTTTTPRHLFEAPFKTLPIFLSPLRTSFPARRLACRAKVSDSDSRVCQLARLLFFQIVGSNVTGTKTNLPPLKDLIKVFKDTVQNGETKTVSELEGVFCDIEFEKNELRQQLTQLSLDISSEKNLYLRMQADFDNYRKRVGKDRLTLTADIQRELIESLLPLVDNFEKAKKYFKPESDREKTINTSYQGIYKQFVEAMRSLKVAIVQTVGKPFDPSAHETVARIESKEFKEGIVVEECQRGFRVGELLLRPAKVKVSTGPGHSKAFANAGKSTTASAAESVLLDDN